MILISLPWRFQYEGSNKEKDNVDKHKNDVNYPKFCLNVYLIVVTMTKKLFFHTITEINIKTKYFSAHFLQPIKLMLHEIEGFTMQLTIYKLWTFLHITLIQKKHTSRLRAYKLNQSYF